MTVKEISNGIPRLTKQLRELGELSVTIDFGSGRHAPSGLPMATLAKIHEFGMGHIPARPAIRRITQNARAVKFLADETEKAVKTVLDKNGKPSTAMVIPAEALAEAVRMSYDSAKAWATPLAATTIKKKGHDIPLQETTALINAVGWAIRKRGRFVRRGK